MAKKRKMNLENAMILSLLIGIIIVVLTLIIARPAPETFTQLYINDFKSLPKFLSDGESTNFSVTINNLERENRTYNYTLKKELYKLNYCNQPKLYISDNQTHTYHLDPAQIVKEDYYELGLRYKPRSKYPTAQILFGEQYSFTFDEESNLILFESEDFAKEIKHDFKLFEDKRIKLIHAKDELKLYLNNILIEKYDIEQPLTKGYFDFKIQKGFVTFHDIKTLQNDQEIDYRIHNTDLEYKSNNLKKLEDIYSFEFENNDNFYLETRYSGDNIFNISNTSLNLSDGPKTLRLLYTNNTLEIYKDGDLFETVEGNFSDSELSLETIESKTKSIELITSTNYNTYKLGGVDIDSFNKIIEKFAMLNIPEEDIRERYLEILADQERDIAFSFNYIIQNDSEYTAKLDDFVVTIMKDQIIINNESYPVSQNEQWNHFRINSKDDIVIRNNENVILRLNQTFNSTPLLRLNSSNIVTKDVVLRDGDYMENFDDGECPMDNFKTISEENTLYVPYEHNGTLDFNISINESYDYAKVSLSIKNNTQDVYFWVMDI